MNITELVNETMTIYNDDLTTGFAEPLDTDYLFIISDEIGTKANLNKRDFTKFTKLVIVKFVENHLLKDK